MLRQLILFVRPVVISLSLCQLCSCKHCRELATPSPAPEIIVFTAELGPVYFPHTKHQHQLLNNCAQCHHKGSEKDHRCRNCHKRKIETKEGDPVSFFDVKMKLCRGCHQQLRDNEKSRTAPIHCTECHDVKKIQWKKVVQP